MEELRREERRDGTERVTHETLASNGRRRVGSVAVTREGVAALEDEEDTDGDEGQGDDGRDPVKVLVLGEGVDEETNGQPDGAEESTVQSGLGLRVLAPLHHAFELLDLEEVETEADRGTQDQGDVGKTRDTLVPALLLVESDGDDGEEEEGQEPGETDPETEEEHDRLGDQHLDGLDGRAVQHVLDTGGLDLVGGAVALVTGLGTEELSTLGEGHGATGFAESEDNDNTQGDIGETLDTLDPAPAKGLVDESGVDGSADGSQDGNIRESGHGNGTVFRAVHVAESTADQDGADATEETEQGTADDDSGDVLTEGETDEHEREADVGTNVNDSAASQLTEGSQEERSQGTSEVESKETKLAELFRHTEFGSHAANTGAVGCRSETDEESHETEEQRDERLVARVPVEGVLRVFRREFDHNELVAIVLLRAG